MKLYLHVDNNEAFICADIKLTSNAENDQTEPEALVDSTLEIGELASLVNFVWWADDGDNVFESDEKVISRGPIGALGVGGSTTITLADSQTNIWNAGNVGGPIAGNETKYIGKAWCFGNIGTAPVTLLGNESQTDSLTADVIFSAVQARHNDGFLCVPPVVKERGNVVVTKVVVNDNGGNNIISNFSLFLDDGLVANPVTSGVTSTLPVGAYTVTETGVQGYQACFSGDCNADGEVTVVNNQTKYCTITNNDLPANITLVKKVINNNAGTAGTSSNWGLKIDGLTVPHNASQAVTSNVPHAINETGRAGYTFVSMLGTSTYGKPCPAVLNGTITLDEGETIVCTITNDDNNPI